MKEILRAILSIALVLGGGWLIWSSFNKSRRCRVPMEAEIMGTERKTHRSNGRTQVRYAPVLRFKLDNVEYQATADVSSVFQKKYKVGETMQIRYNAEDPGEFMVKGKSLRSGLLTGVLMLVLGLLGVYFFILK